ncbi:hypothetical protein [Crocosphaera sp.]|nr:hypothetical protein [Crocosphaera sp.]MDJ0579503.1 hypothetical protein [Crocosphaera sp.]
MVFLDLIINEPYTIAFFTALKLRAIALCIYLVNLRGKIINTHHTKT